MIDQSEKSYVRPDNLLEAFGIQHEKLTDEERAMQQLLLEEYKRTNKVFVEEIRNWREKTPEATLGAAIRALYEELENR